LVREAYPNLSMHVRKAMRELSIPMTPQRERYIKLYCITKIIANPPRNAAHRRVWPNDVAIMIGTIMSDWLHEYRDEVAYPGTELSFHIITLSDTVRRFANWHPGLGE
jgi:hypothetical protein